MIPHPPFSLLELMLSPRRALAMLSAQADRILALETEVRKLRRTNYQIRADRVSRPAQKEPPVVMLSDVIFDCPAPSLEDPSQR